ncbi:WxL domain-containing protein [Actinomadura flavalba]|uniref:WxL domain-containing protein n=1 Tax=Actinomadura flavalba TaxID=1120938 RepID=UPI0003708F93|nr:WxL domain-containing protein [Actinomadura flavalba]
MQSIATRLVRGTVVVGTAAFVTAGLGLAPAFAAGPATTVSPTTGANPAGQDLTIQGSGFNANANGGMGVYVAFGPKTADYATNAGAFQVSKWVHKNAAPGSSQIKMNADGTFSLTLPGVKAKYTNGDGDEVNCLTTQCYVITIAAHGSPDRSQDSFTAVTFTGGENPGEPGEPGPEEPPPGSSTGEQTITAKVARTGALTLAVAGTNVALSEAGPGGKATGALNKATVTDARGTNAGWSLVGQLGDLTSAGGGTIPAANMAWTPNAAVVNDGSQGAVVAGPAVNGLDVARTLASSAGGASGGVFEAGAGLDLGIPAGVVPGDYTGTLTLTLS